MTFIEDMQDQLRIEIEDWAREHGLYKPYSEPIRDLLEILYQNGEELWERMLEAEENQAMFCEEILEYKRIIEGHRKTIEKLEKEGDL